MIQRRLAQQQRTRRAAFTLMEILIVVSIIIALAAVGGVYFFGALAENEEQAARMQSLELTKACKIYFAKNREWPQSLEQLLLPDEKFGNRPYLENQNALKTPFGGMYQYDPSGARNAAKSVTQVALQPDIWAVTKEGKEIGNWPEN